MLKQCGVCNKMFEPCNDCPSTAYSWKKTVCCVEHSAPFIAILEYKRGLSTKEQARKLLENIKDIDYNNIAKAIVDEIFYEPKTEVETVETIIKTKKRK